MYIYIYIYIYVYIYPRSLTATYNTNEYYSRHIHYTNALLNARIRYIYKIIWQKM